jgi:hypothetical protein
MARKGRRGRLARWVLRVGLVALAALGVWLITTVEFGPDTRVELGASLLTGVVVGTVLIAHEHLLGVRRAREADETRERLRDGLCTEAERVVASFLGAHVMTIIGAFVQVAPVPAQRGPGRPSSVVSDDRLTLGRLTASGRRLEADASWWRTRPEALDEVLRAYAAAVMLAERVGLAVSPVWEEIDRARAHAVARLTRMAERLSAAGFMSEARDLDQLAEALESGWGLLDLEHRSVEPGPWLGPWRPLIAEACWLGRRLGADASRATSAGGRAAADPAPVGG